MMKVHVVTVVIEKNLVQDRLNFISNNVSIISGKPDVHPIISQ